MLTMNSMTDPGPGAQAAGKAGPSQSLSEAVCCEKGAAKENLLRASKARM